MLKKTKLKKTLLEVLLNFIAVSLLSKLYSYKDKTLLAYKYNFKLTHKIRQFNFSITNMILSFTKIISTGTLLKDFLQNFKFFKRSISNTNPLIFRLKTKFLKIFNNIYIYESLNFSKKHYLFFKKILEDLSVYIKYFLVSKTWKYSKKPVKRIKRRVLKLVKLL